MDRVNTNRIWLSIEKLVKANRNASNIYQLNVEKLASAARIALTSRF
ncbi:hypothetical protein J4731_08275 [Providencia rettgeri]|nr:hypothetical protein [Providencia rettgeri]